MAIALVTGQLATVDGGPFGAQNIVLPNNPTAGNFVAVTIAVSVASTISAQDSNSNSYVHVTSSPFLANSQQVAILYLANAPANATKTVTVTCSGGPLGDIWIGEWSGVATLPLETTNTAAIASTGSITTPTITTANDGDLLITCVGTQGTITAAGSPWTGMGAFPTTQGEGAAYMIQSTHGTQAVAFTNSPAGAAAGIVAAFKAAVAAAAAPDAPSLLMMGVGI